MSNRRCMNEQIREEKEIKCTKCSLSVNVTKKAKRLRCSRCYAEIQLQINYDTIQGSNEVRKKQKERPDQKTTGSFASVYSSFAPSNMASRKRALICGVSYNRQKYELKGTINDVYQMMDFLQQNGFPEHEIRILAEEENRIEPTKKNMEEGLRWLVEDCKPGDSLVFFFSGHGLRQRDHVFDELDGYDETLCPVDFSTKGIILDNDINAMIVKPLIQGVTLHAIIDACHSGTVLDLEYVYSHKRKEWTDNSPPNGAKKGTNGGIAFCLSACHDDQMAADTSAFLKHGMTGAMTYCFIDALKRKPKLSYHELLISMEETIVKAYQSRCISAKLFDRLLHRHFLQEPQLSCSKILDVENTLFQL